jgi:hypothetical protein
MERPSSISDSEAVLDGPSPQHAAPASPESPHGGHSVTPAWVNPRAAEEAKLPGGFAWGLVIALAILGLVELGVRIAPPAKVIPYRNGLDEHYALASYLRATGSADVGFIGSSLTRQGILAPEVKERLESITGGPVRVANYGAAATGADEVYYIVRYMIRHNATPRLLLIEVSPRSFHMVAHDNRIAIFWTLPDWWQARKQGREISRGMLPSVIRNQVGELWATFRYRKTPRIWFEETFLDAPHFPAPMNGDLPLAHIEDKPKETPKQMEIWARRILQDKEFGMDPALVRDLDKALALCRQEGTPVILFEVPVRDFLARRLPPNLGQEFGRIATELARKNNVPLARLDDLQTGIDLTDATNDFKDISHLSYEGAQKYTTALLDRVLGPYVREHWLGK